MSDLLERITRKPGVCGGKPAIRGTKIRVSDVLELLADDHTFQDVVELFPYLETDDIKACLLYASRKLQGALAERKSRSMCEYY